jgi:hypothetical protein
MKGAFRNPHQFLVEPLLEPNLDESTRSERRLGPGIIDAGEQVNAPLGGIDLTK